MKPPTPEDRDLYALRQNISRETRRLVLPLAVIVASLAALAALWVLR